MSAIDLVELVDAPTLARKLYETHAKFHGFSGERWNDEPWQSRHSWLNIAKTAIEAIQPADTITRLQAALDETVEALTDIRNRILCPVGPSPTLDDVQNIASDALEAVGGE